MVLSPGDVVGGRYALEGLVGAGGMGQVYRARDRVLERRVAVKLMYPPDALRKTNTDKAFLKEARISAAIAHRNVVQILDFGLHEGQVPFMVMELLEGESLGHVLRRGDAISMDFIMEVIPQALAGVAVAHDARVVHRDLKPDNIFLARTREGICPKILDFGVSKILGRDPMGPFNQTSSAGQILGTPAYMSPEQARGLGRLDERTDVYSMGVVLYELFSGLLPFDAESVYELLTKIIQEEERPLRQISAGVSPEIEACVRKAMRKNPRERFADANELRTALVSAASSMSSHWVPLGAPRAAGHAGGTPGELPTMMVTPEPSAAPTAAPVPTLVTTKQSGAFCGSFQRARTGRRPRVLALGGAVLLTLTAVIVLLLRRASPEEANQRIIVVSAAARGSPEPPTLPRVPGSAVSSAADPAELLTRSLRAQKAGLARCIRVHRPLALQHPRLSVKFDVAADGRVLMATASPPEIRETALGMCLAEAAKAVMLDPPGVAVSLEVPLTTRSAGPSSESAQEPPRTP